MSHIITVASIAAADLGLKAHAENNPKMNKYHNYGLPFGKMKERPQWVMSIPLVVTSGILGVWAAGLIDKKSADYSEVKQTALSLILAGGISNVVDRLKRGYVVDYLNNPKAKGKAKNFFFNLGDVAIWIGSGVYFIWTVMSRHKS